MISSTEFEKCPGCSFSKMHCLCSFKQQPTNPDIGPKYDDGKLQYSLIPPVATKALAEVLTFGAKKYLPNSWQKVPDAERRYLDALMRHLDAYRSGEEFDPESNLSHLSHLLCNASFLLHFQNERLKNGSTN